MLSKNSKRFMNIVFTASLVAGVGGISRTAITARKKVSLKKKTINVNVGKTKKIEIKNKRNNCKYTFESNKPGIAKVNKSGKITALKKGKAKITVCEITKSGKKRKVGVVIVVVKPIVVKSSMGSASTAAVTAVTTAAATAIVVNTPEGTMEPAYGSYSFDEFTLKGSNTLPMDKLMKYGGKCEVRFKALQNSGSSKDITIGYSGSKYSKGFNHNGDSFSGESQTVTVSSGDAKEYSAVLTIDKYMLDCGIDMYSDANTEIKISDISVTTTPFEDGDYQKMLDDSLISEGNNSRLKKVINKALSGEDVTLAYLGGSITEGCAATDMTVNSDCYAETSYNEFKTRFGAGDGSNVHFINAGMSGTPSSLGVIRYQNDVLNQMEFGKYPDVLFIEFVVNDSGECTNGEGIESLIRQGLEQGSAVFLVFAHTVNFDTGKQEYYIPLGEKYDLPMISVKNAISGFLDPKDTKNCALSKWFFWHDTLHPDVPGHRLMADMIMNVFEKAYEEDEVPDPITDVESVEPKYGKSFTGMTLLDSNVDISKVDAIESLDVGSFGDKDTAQNRFQYKKGGQDGVEWFPNCWMHQSGTVSFRAAVKCSNMMIAYKLANDSNYGKAELYVDGKLKETMDAYKSDGWNNATVSVVFKDDDISTHEFEIKMASGNENKKFTIYAIGYTNSDDYKKSLEK